MIMRRWSVVVIRSKREHRMKKIVLFVILLLMIISGCAVLANSAQYYRDHPPGPINWNEYED